MKHELSPISDLYDWNQDSIWLYSATCTHNGKYDWRPASIRELTDTNGFVDIPYLSRNSTNQDWKIIRLIRDL
jgi:hypothetical protein